MTQQLNSYELSRTWFDFCFANPESIKPNHTALYFFAIEHCNRLGWKLKFGFPTQMAMEAIGIKSFATYSNTLADLVDWGFIIMIEKSKNQYSSNIVAISKFDKALVKALDKALVKHTSKQHRKQRESTYESIVESIDSIDKQVTSNNEPITINKEQAPAKKFALIFPFGSSEFLALWDSWVEFRQEIKKPYHTFSEQQAALQYLSKYNEQTAIEIIYQSIRNKWKDFFPLKDNGKQTSSNKQADANQLGATAREFLRQSQNRNHDPGH
jgi:hypothetical protein